MNLFLISYDLKSVDRNYEGVSMVIQTAIASMRILESVWIIRTNKTIEEWRELLKSQINTDTDLLFICQITDSQRSGWHYRKTWDWIREQIVACNDKSVNG